MILRKNVSTLTHSRFIADNNAVNEKKAKKKKTIQWIAIANWFIYVWTTADIERARCAHRIGVAKWSHLICNFDCVDKSKQIQYHTKRGWAWGWDQSRSHCSLSNTTSVRCLAFVIYERLRNSIYCYIFHGFFEKIDIHNLLWFFVVSIKMIRMNL